MRLWCGGTYDLLHAGHLALFREASELAALDGRAPGRTVTVAVNSDEFVLRFKNKKPVQTLQERLAMVAAIRYVDEVQVNDGTDQPGLILAAQTDVILVGDDWEHRDYVTQLGIDQSWIENHHVDIRYLKRVGGWSSTQLKARVGARQLG